MLILLKNEKKSLDFVAYLHCEKSVLYLMHVHLHYIPVNAYAYISNTTMYKSTIMEQFNGKCSEKCHGGILGNRRKLKTIDWVGKFL